MVIKSLPDSMWLYYYSRTAPIAADEVADFSQNIFQRILSDEEYVRLVDTRTGEVIRIYAHINMDTGVSIPTICIKLNRTIRSNGQTDNVGVEYWLSNDGNRPILTLMDFQVPPAAQGKGL